LNWIRYTIVNALLAWAAVKYGGHYLHQPGQLSLQIHFGLPVQMLAFAFSSLAPLGLPFVSPKPMARALWTLVAIGLCVPLAGLLWAATTPFVEPLAGAQLALLTAWNSPALTAVASLWALLWTALSFPAAKPAFKEPQEPREPAVVEPASDWIGSSR